MYGREARCSDGVYRMVGKESPWTGESRCDWVYRKGCRGVWVLDAIGKVEEEGI